MKLLVLAAFLAILNSSCDCASIMKSEEFSEKLQNMVNMYSENLRTQRSTENANEEHVRNCDENNPCGWLSYSSSTRMAQGEFMANTCKCPDKTYKCVRSGENVSMRAFVYHCRQNTTADDIEGIEGEPADDTDYVS